jgi:hypothetical protein
LSTETRVPVQTSEKRASIGPRLSRAQRRVEASTMAYVMDLTRAIETSVYETLHSLLGQLAKDYSLDHGELVDRYLVRGREGSPPPSFIYTKEVETPKAPKKAKVKVTRADSDSEEREGKCTALTAKGTQCKNKAFGGGCMCRVHSKGTEPKEAKAPKEAKKRGRKAKAEPEHTHKLDEMAGGDCELCETHGNPLNGEQEFEVKDEQRVVASAKAAMEKRMSKKFARAMRDASDDEEELSETELDALAAEMENAIESEEDFD